MPSPLTIQPSGKDNSLLSHAPTYVASADVQLYLRGVSGFVYRPILYFDASALPDGATITSATLSLYFFNYAATTPSGISTNVYKLTRDDWTDAASCWNNYKASTAWTAGGGDFVTSNPSGATTNMPASYDWVTWNVKDIVVDAVANVSKHVNLLLKFTAETGTDYASYFHSSDYTDDTSLRPKLVIEYSTGNSNSMFQVF